MQSVPTVVARLLASPTEGERDEAWQAFVAEYSRLLLHVARSVAPGYDDAMDGYTHALGVLRANECARIRTFVADGRSKFTTWLVVVVRRACVDHLRSRYGRQRPGEGETVRVDRALRRRLHELAGEDLELSELPAAEGSASDDLISKERTDALTAALEKLAPPDRLMVKLRFEDGLAAGAIARLMGLPTQFHVFRRLEVIAAALRRSLVAKGVTSAVG